MQECYADWQNHNSSAQWSNNWFTLSGKLMKMVYQGSRHRDVMRTPETVDVLAILVESGCACSKRPRHHWTSLSVSMLLSCVCAIIFDGMSIARFKSKDTSASIANSKCNGANGIPTAGQDCFAMAYECGVAMHTFRSACSSWSASLETRQP